MPLDDQGHPLYGMVYNFQIAPPEGSPYSIQVYIFGDGSGNDTIDVTDAAAQSLVDVLEAWDGQAGDVFAWRGVPSQVRITPTTPKPLPPPPEPDGGSGGTGGLTSSQP